ncbi:hypothetical protein MFUL124B02_08860 [Myxococcus fulvus 124B02]|nr:hypothetical protein MFUL124B02_08860 [Myxococcus fulvus 124B02]
MDVGWRALTRKPPPSMNKLDAEAVTEDFK